MEIVEQITILSIVLTGAALIREREHGTVEHLLVMPLTPFEIMTAKVWANGLVILIATTSVSAVGDSRALASTDRRLGARCFSSARLFICSQRLPWAFFSARWRARCRSSGLLAILVIWPLVLLSGAVTPRESMPQIVQTIMQVAPTTHFVSLTQAIIYRGAGFDVVWPQFVILIGIGALFFTAALLRFRRAITLTG